MKFLFWQSFRYFSQESLSSEKQKMEKQSTPASSVQLITYKSSESRTVDLIEKLIVDKKFWSTIKVCVKVVDLSSWSSVRVTVCGPIVGGYVQSSSSGRPVRSHQSEVGTSSGVLWVRSDPVGHWDDGWRSFVRRRGQVPPQCRHPTPSPSLNPKKTLTKLLCNLTWHGRHPFLKCVRWRTVTWIYGTVPRDTRHPWSWHRWGSVYYG